MGILLAEDHNINQRVAKLFLASLGYRADVTANGFEVLEALRRRNYEIIIMDVQMPEMDGLEATRRIRASCSPGETGPWILALTANALIEDREFCLAAGMDDYISKPLTKDSLAAALDRARRHRSAQASGSAAPAPGLVEVQPVPVGA